MNVDQTFYSKFLFNALYLIFLGFLLELNRITYKIADIFKAWEWKVEKLRILLLRCDPKDICSNEIEEISESLDICILINRKHIRYSYSIRIEFATFLSNHHKFTADHLPFNWSRGSKVGLLTEIHIEFAQNGSLGRRRRLTWSNLQTLDSYTVMKRSK